MTNNVATLPRPRLVQSKPTHCAYRGCMKPLPMTTPAFKCDDKHYCDQSCSERNASYLLRFRDGQ